MTLPRSIDIFEFARSQQSLDGVANVSDFERLSEVVADPSGQVHWSASGEYTIDASGQKTTHAVRIAARAELGVVCQRCMQPMSYPLDILSKLILATDPAELESDEDMEDEEIDLVLGSEQFDLHEQLEDELLLNIPFAPRHLSCEGDAQLDATRKAASPFAQLASLKNPAK